MTSWGREEGVECVQVYRVMKKEAGEWNFQGER